MGVIYRDADTGEEFAEGDRDLSQYEEVTPSVMYRDADTGEMFSPDERDLSQYEEVPQESSWDNWWGDVGKGWGAVRDRIEAVPYELASTTGQLRKMNREVMPNFYGDSLTNKLNELNTQLGIGPDPQADEKLIQWGRQKADDLYAQSPIEPGTIASGVASTPAMAVRIGLPAIATRGRSLMPQIAIESTAHKYGDIRSELGPDGQPLIDPQDAALAASGYGAVQGVLAGTGIANAFGGRSALKKMILTPLEFELMGAGTLASDYAIDKSLFGESRIPEGETWNRIKATALENLGTGLAFGGLGAAKSSFKPKKSPQQVEATLPDIGTEVVESQALPDRNTITGDVAPEATPEVPATTLTAPEPTFRPELAERKFAERLPEPVKIGEATEAFPASLPKKIDTGMRTFEGKQISKLELDQGGQKLYEQGQARERAGQKKVAEQIEAPYEPVNKTLTRPEEIAAEKNFYQEINSRGDDLINDYIRDNRKDSGAIVIDTDLAREYSKDYAASQESRAGLANAVHEPASEISKRAYEAALTLPPTNNEVVFLAGGGGSGKSSALKISTLENKADIIYDGTLSNFKSSKQKIDQALESGRNVTILYSHSGVGPGAQRAMKRALRIGRAVPVDSLAKAHYESPRTFLQLSEAFRGDPRVRLVAQDTSTREIKSIPVDVLADNVYNKGIGGDYEQHRHEAQRAYLEVLSQARESGQHPERLIRQLEASLGPSRSSGPSDSRGLSASIEESGTGSGGSGPEGPAPQPSSKLNPLNNERGAVTIPRPLAQVGEYVRDKMLSMKDPVAEMEARLAELDPEGQITSRYKGVDPSTRHFDPKGLWLVKEAKAAFRKSFTRPQALARKFPEDAGPVWELQKERMRDKHAMTFDLVGKGADYFNLLDKTKVNQMLASARIKARKLAKEGKKLVVTEQDLASKGLSPEEIKGYVAVRNMFNHAWDTLRDRTIANGERLFPDDPLKRQEWESEVHRQFGVMKDSHYVPFSRKGKFYVYAVPKEGVQGEPWYSFHDSVKEQAETVKNLNDRGFDAEFGEFEPKSVEAYNGLEGGLVFDLMKLNPDVENAPNSKLSKTGKIPLEGFKGHLLHAKLVDGFERDLSVSIADYVNGVSSYLSKLKYEPAVTSAIDAVKQKGKPLLYDELVKHERFLKSNTPEYRAIKAFMAHNYLGFMNPKAGIVNLTQLPMVAYPELGKHVKGIGQAEKVMAQSSFLAGKYLLRPEAFKKSNPDLYNLLEGAKREGILGQGQHADLLNYQPGMSKAIKTLSDASMLFQTVTDKFTRTTAIIAGYKAAKGTPEQKAKFAKDFNDRVSFIYGKLDRPAIARGPVRSMLYQFRHYMVNYLGALKDNVTEGEYKALTRQIVMATAFGGLPAIAGGNAIINAITTAGGDPKRWIRKQVDDEDWANFLLWGLPAAFGFNIGSSVALPSMMEGIEQGPIAAAARLIGGSAVGYGQHILRANDARKVTGGDPWLTGEILLPAALKRLSQSARALKDDAFKDYKGNVLMEKDPTKLGEWYSAVAKNALGFQPNELALGTEKKNSAYLSEKAYDRQTAGYADQLAFAMQLPNWEERQGRAKAILEELSTLDLGPNKAKRINNVISSAIKKRMGQGNSDLQIFQNASEGNYKDIADILQTYRK